MILLMQLLTLNKSKNIVTRAEKIAFHFRCILLSCGLELLFFLGGGGVVAFFITLLLARAHEKVDLK